MKITQPIDTVLDLYRVGMVSRKYVEDTLGITALEAGPHATAMHWIGDCWVVFFDDVIWVESLYLDFINENIDGWHKKDQDGRSWCFENKADATLFLLRFK